MIEAAARVREGTGRAGGSRTLGRCILALAAVAWAALSFAGEDPPADPERARALIERMGSGGPPLSDEELAVVLGSLPGNTARADLVMTAAQVVDRNGRLVRGLTADAFRLYEDGQPRAIGWFAEEHDRPLRLAILLDVSASMGWGEQVERVREALRPLVRRLRRHDRVMLMTFADERVASRTGWSRFPLTLLRDLTRIPRRGRTALADALAAAAQIVPDAELGRRAILIVSDGHDNASRIGPDQAAAHARRIGLPVYAFGIGGLDQQIRFGRRPGGALETLTRVAESTGGRAFLVRDAASAEQAARALAEELRHQYWLAFTPPHPPDGRFHRLKIEVSGRGLTVRAREGYR